MELLASGFWFPVARSNPRPQTLRGGLVAEEAAELRGIGGRSKIKGVNQDFSRRSVQASTSRRAEAKVMAGKVLHKSKMWPLKEMQKPAEEADKTSDSHRIAKWLEAEYGNKWKNNDMKRLCTLKQILASWSTGTTMCATRCLAYQAVDISFTSKVTQTMFSVFAF